MGHDASRRGFPRSRRVLRDRSRETRAVVFIRDFNIQCDFDRSSVMYETDDFYSS